jgi:hypothetical protein
MDLTLREEYWIKFCMRLVAVISHDNYYNQFCHPSDYEPLRYLNEASLYIMETCGCNCKFTSCKYLQIFQGIRCTGDFVNARE